MIWLLDTNTIIYAQYRGGAVRERLDDASKRGRVVTSILVVAELLYGAERSARPEANREKVDQIVRAVDVLPVTMNTAGRFATLKRELVSEGGTKPTWTCTLQLRQSKPAPPLSPTTAPFWPAISRAL